MALSDIAVALAVVLIVLGATGGLLYPARRAVLIQTHTAEMHQRMRSGFSRLQRDIGTTSVASRDPRTSALRFRATVVPTTTGWQRASEPASGERFDPNALTLLNVIDESRTVTSSALSEAAPWVDVGHGAVCEDRPPGASGHCIDLDSLLLLGDGAGRTDLVRVIRIEVGRIWVRSVGGVAGVPDYAAGATLVPAELRTYRFDPLRSQLRFRRDGAAFVPVLDNVASVRFRYFGVSPWWRVVAAERHGVSSCGVDEESLGANVDPAIAELSRDVLSDGPWCGGGASFDADMLRLRRVQVEVRFHASIAELRGTDPTVFVRPGFAVDARRWVPDLAARFDQSLRVPWRP